MSKVDALNWFTVDTDSMSPALKAAYAKLQKAQQAQREAEETFETLFTREARKAEALPEDKILRFGYRYGRLAVAAIEQDKVKPKASGKPKFSF